MGAYKPAFTVKVQKLRKVHKVTFTFRDETAYDAFLAHMNSEQNTYIGSRLNDADREAD